MSYEARSQGAAAEAKTYYKPKMSRMEPMAEVGAKKGSGQRLGRAGNGPYTGAGAFHR